MKYLISLGKTSNFHVFNLAYFLLKFHLDLNVRKLSGRMEPLLSGVIEPYLFVCFHYFCDLLLPLVHSISFWLATVYFLIRASLILAALS